MEQGKDALEGFEWPPRSYFCNFCGRKFASAQALGGHMNVHRRERAELNHSSGFNNGLSHHQTQQKQLQIPRKIVRSAYPCALVTSKRRKVDGLSTPFLVPDNKDHLLLQAEVNRVCHGETSDLDLELRLGFSLF